MSPDFAHLGSESGRVVLRYTINARVEGIGTFEKGGKVGSDSSKSGIVGSIINDLCIYNEVSVTASVRYQQMISRSG
jgi:hypothetical protein